jgi:hypothetical protein
MFQKAGIIPLHWYVSSEQASGSNKPIVMPTDMKGLLIRAGANETVVVLQRLGAVPAQIASGEVDRISSLVNELLDSPGRLIQSWIWRISILFGWDDPFGFNRNKEEESF